MNKWLAVFSIVALGLEYLSPDGSADVVVKDQNGQAVTETTLAAREVEDVLREIRDETGLTEEQVPMLIQYVYMQLREAIAEAMQATYSFDMKCAGAA